MDELDIFKSGHGEASFFLVYGAEAVIPHGNHNGHPPMSRHTTKPCRTIYGVMILTSLMSEDGKQCSEMHGSIRRSGAITNSSCIVGSSRWTIWCSSAYSPVKAQTSSPPTGRVLSG
jgi:hypothetical protein